MALPLQLARLTIVVVVVAVALHHIGDCLQHESIAKSFKFPHKRLVVSDSSFDNKTLFYAVCSRPPKQCTIVQDLSPFVNSSTTRKCDVSLMADNVQLIVGLGEDRAIVVTQETSSKSTILKMTLVHMPSCTITDAELFEIPESWKGVQMYRRHMDVVVFQDGFEVIVKGLGQICNKTEQKTYCSFEYNKDGRRIEGPIIWPKTPYRVTNISTSIIPDTLGRWYFFIDHNVTLTGLQLNRNGGPTYIKLWGPTELHTGYWSVGYSVANDAYGMCYSEDYTLRCWQHTLYDGHKMKKEFTIHREHDTWNIYVHNLRKGGLMVLMVNCPNRVCAGADDQYYFAKIDAQGRMLGHLELDFLSSCNAKNGDIMAKVFENERGLYCAARLCRTQFQEKAKLEAIVHCYSDDHFTKR